MRDVVAAVNVATDVAAGNLPSSRWLDQQFGQWVVRNFAASLDVAPQRQLTRLAEAVSYVTGLKHTCLDLDTYKHLQDPVLDNLLRDIDAGIVLDLVTPAIKPLVCAADGKLVWLQKYHAFETGVAESLLQRVAHACSVSPKQKQMLETLFNPEAAEQKSAAEKALTSRLAIITGGPGTGKTWTAARIIALLKAENAALDVQLAAPTGKAGARMMQALADAFLSDVAMQEHRHLLDSLPKKAATLDGLLRINNRLSPKPGKDRHDPLLCDVLIVDEASMIALPMMYRLLDALRPEARLILLGDKDQLASVEVGNVMGEICNAGGPLAEAMAAMTVSRRFPPDGEVGRLARALNEGYTDFADQPQQVMRHRLAGRSQKPEWRVLAVDAFRELEKRIVSGAGITDVLAHQNDFQILCALREGPQGVSGINTVLAVALGHKPAGWYAGLPVMMVQNDHARKLYNGDTGLVLPLAGDGVTIDCNNGTLKACFLVDGAVKTVSRAQMPAYESCYAITVHKSQGSEYGHVLVILPAEKKSVQDNAVITRELVYTAITRSKSHIDIFCGDGVIEAAAQQQTVRMSGLGYCLAVGDR